MQLTSSVSAAANRYAGVVVNLDKESTRSAEAFRDLLAVAEDAKRSCILARRELEGHVSDHQC